MPPTFSAGNVADVSMDITPGGLLTDVSEYVNSIIINSDREEITLKRLGGFPDVRLVQSLAHGGTITGWMHPTISNALRAHMDQTDPQTCSLQWDPQSTTSAGPRRAAEILFTHLEEETGSEDGARWSADFVIDGELTTADQAA